MEEVAIIAISELAKAGIQFYTSYMRQQGLTEEQIQTVFDAARAEMMTKDPSKLPN